MVESIWFMTPTVDTLNTFRENSLSGTLGIEFTEVGSDFIRGTMPVTDITRQPAGILHGGASVSLAETLGSVGAFLTVDPAKYGVVGLDINANHIKSVRDGIVIGTAKPLHLGKRTQVWEIDIRNEQDKRVCISRLTIAILEQSKPAGS